MAPLGLFCFIFPIYSLPMAMPPPSLRRADEILVPVLHTPCCRSPLWDNGWGPDGWVGCGPCRQELSAKQRAEPLGCVSLCCPPPPASSPRGALCSDARVAPFSPYSPTPALCFLPLLFCQLCAPVSASGPELEAAARDGRAWCQLCLCSPCRTLTRAGIRLLPPGMCQQLPRLRVL